MKQNELKEHTAELVTFVYGLPDEGLLLAINPSRIKLGGKEQEFHVWARRSRRPYRIDEMKDLFKIDIRSWFKSAGRNAILIVKHGPEFAQNFESIEPDYRLFAWLGVADEDYNPVPPPFDPKPETKLIEFMPSEA